MIILSIFLLVIGFVMLVKGADWFVDGASALAVRFGIPQLVIGLTIVAMGTSLPEAAVSITAAIRENAGISIGNVVGSNILNVLIILGITACLVSIAVQRSTLFYEIPFMLLITGILLAMGVTGQEVNRIEGIILLLLFISYLVYLYFLSQKGNGESSQEKIEMSLGKCAICIWMGGMAIVLGSHLAVKGASDLARIFGVSERFIGLTIVALGTSLPELVTSVTAALKGNADIAIGNIVGSNIFNILFVLGISAIICDIPYAADFRIDVVIAILAGVLLWIFSVGKKKLTRGGGIAMLLVYAAYFVYLCG